MRYYAIHPITPGNHQPACLERVVWQTLGPAFVEDTHAGSKGAVDEGRPRGPHGGSLTYGARDRLARYEGAGLVGVEDGARNHLGWLC